MMHLCQMLGKCCSTQNLISTIDYCIENIHDEMKDDNNNALKFIKKSRIKRRLGNNVKIFRKRGK